MKKVAAQARIRLAIVARIWSSQGEQLLRSCHQTKGSGTAELPRLVHNASSLLGGVAIAQALSAGYAILVARNLSAPEYGSLAGTYATVSITTIAFNLGLDTWVLREGTITGDIRKAVATILLIKAALSFAWASGILLVLPGVGPQLFGTPIVVLSVVDAVCEGAFTAQLAALNAMQRSQLASSLIVLSRGGRFLGAVALGIIGSHTPIVYAQLRLLATLAALLLVTKSVRPDWHLPSIGLIRQTIRQSLAYGASDAFASIYLQADVSMLALISNDPRAVGLYAPAENMVNALFTIPASAYVVLIPSLTRLRSKQSPEFRRVVRWAYLGYGALGVSLGIACAVGGSWALPRLLGTGYLLSGSIVALLSPILFLKSISYASASLLVAMGWQRQRLTVQAVSAILDISLALYLIPIWGLWGVSYAYIISEAVLMVGYLAFTWSGLRAHPMAWEAADDRT